jgi:hypothetical protein
LIVSPQQGAQLYRRELLRRQTVSHLQRFVVVVVVLVMPIQDPYDATTRQDETAFMLFFVLPFPLPFH